MTTDAAIRRFKFIGEALTGEGGFRPVVVSTYHTDGQELPQVTGLCYLNRYPRESKEKYSRRAEVAFYASPLAQACSRFVGYISTKPPMRTLGNPLYETMEEDIDGQGNCLEVWLQQFMVAAKARGSMLVLVDMPAALSPNLAAQLADRRVPYWTQIAPETLTSWEIGDDGKFNFCEFPGLFTKENGERVNCTWHFNREGWQARDDAKKQTLGEGDHPLGECPVLIFTENGAFPSFGPFAAIADLAKRLFNLDSELDEILRSQTFSLLTMEVPADSNLEQKLAAARSAGETISTNNLMVHSGSTPAFIAPPDGPANVYLQRIDKIRDQIKEIGLDIASINQQESGIAMQTRFQIINGQLAYFAERVEDFEARMWTLSQKWLGLSVAPEVEWHDDYNIADVLQELEILAQMQATAMPPEVIAEQRRRIVAVQFGGGDQETIDELQGAIDDGERGIEPAVEDTQGLPADRNAEARAGLLRLVNGS
jgi:hypothetical protein